MAVRPIQLYRQLSLARQYMMASSLVLLGCTIGIGWWISQEIEAGIINETSATTSLYMNSFVAPLVQELSSRDEIAEDNVARLDALIKETPLGRYVVSFKIWSKGGRVVYSTDRSIVGKLFDMGPHAERAWSGTVATEISPLGDEEHVGERKYGTRLLETYSPIRSEKNNEIIAVAEFYQTTDILDAQIARTRLNGWIVLGVAALIVYLVLAGIVRRGSDTIVRQQSELGKKVRQLTNLLKQNQFLSERVRRAATGATARNENILRRISAELHDGPAQALGLAILRLDTAIENTAGSQCSEQTLQQTNEDLVNVQNTVRNALEEIRRLSTGLILPELGGLSIQQTLVRVVRGHETRSNTDVKLELDNLPDKTSLPLKITVYRVVQEALNNASRHGGGKDQEVHAAYMHDRLIVDIVDAGPGFDPQCPLTRRGKLGLEGMRQRVESMGGNFFVDAAPGRGTHIHAEIPEQPAEQNYVQ